MPAARRIFPAPRASRPLHPPSLRPSPLFPPSPGGGGRLGDGGGGRAGPGWGQRGTAPWPAVTGSGMAGKDSREGGSGVSSVMAAGPSPPSVTAPLPESSTTPPPAAALAESESRAKGARPVAVLSPLPTLPTAGHAGVFWGAAPPRARPLSHPGPRADCPQCAPGGSRRRARGVASRGEPQERRASARGPRRCRPPTRPVLKHGPRSLTRARVRGSHESRRGAMKVKAALSRRPRWDPEASPSPPRAHHRPVSPAAPGRWSTSARVRTRKMVNYAWAGRSQRKLWWRSVAVLTCKSVVRPGYRGERLIEPSSSWFPPKFPSG